MKRSTKILILLAVTVVAALVGNQAHAQEVPTCAILANSDHITQGGSSALSWRSAGATSAYIDQLGSVPVSGLTDVRPPVTTTYTMTVSGAGGSATCSRTIYVSESIFTGSYTYVPQTYATDAPQCSVYASPAVVSYGGNTTVTWSCTNAYAVTVDGAGSFAGSGSYTFSNITSTRDIRVFAQGQGGVRTFSALVTLAQPASVYQNTAYNNGYYYTSQQSNGASTYTPSYVAYVPPVQQAPATYYTNYRAPSPVTYASAADTRHYGTPYGSRPAPTYDTATHRRVSLSQIPYTGAEDYVLPFFMLAGVVSAAYAARRVAN